MSYLAFDLDALKMTPDAARSAGVSEAELGYGLVRLWSWCWTTKTDRCQPIHLAGFFGGDPKRVAEALVAFEFLAPGAPGEGFRVRGAERYLRVKKAQSEAGKAAAGNLRKGPEKPVEQAPLVPGSSPAPAGTQPGPSREPAPALTPSTEHRAPKKEEVLQEPVEVRAHIVEPPDTPASEWQASDFWRWAQSKRQKAGFVAERWPHPSKLSSFWSEARALVDVPTLQEAFYAFGDDKHWQTVRPPLPFAAFMSQWNQFVPRGAARV